MAICLADSARYEQVGTMEKLYVVHHVVLSVTVWYCQYKNMVHYKTSNISGIRYCYRGLSKNGVTQQLFYIANVF